MKCKKILLVDDVELFLELEKTFFRRDEVEVLIARTGQDAVDLTLTEHPDLVFMDLFMPMMNGDVACRLIKQNPTSEKTPIIMVTHGGRESDLELCRAAGCDDVLLKPINRNMFMDTARHFLRVTERNSPRAAAKLVVRYGQEMQRQLSDYAVNISSGGLFLETATPLPVETPLVLEFPLPGRDAVVTCQARVAWINEFDSTRQLKLPSGMGLQFLDLGLEDLQAIRDYVKQEYASTMF